MRILIVDDTKSVHFFVKELLKSETGLSFSDAFNGQEALDCVAANEAFDVILLDWEMPVMTGPECLEKLRANGMTSPIVMMTTKNAVDDIRRVLELGASEYLLKPFTCDILKEKIQSVCGEVFQNAG
jgi:two-component system, chemotaxis family, chemotaxis protein CheY